MWVKNFLVTLNKVDTEGGVFFSQAVYGKFHELQLFLFKLRERLLSSNEKIVGLSDLEFIDTIFRGRPGNPGMAALLKDDLGSYRNLSIQVRSDTDTVLMLDDQLKEITEINENPHNVFYKDYGCPPVGSSLNELEQREYVLALRNEIIQISDAALLTPTAGILAIEKILKKQPGFEKNLRNLHKYITHEILKKPKEHINNTDSLIISHLIDSFHLIDLALFVEDNFGIRLDDEELNTKHFDTILELAALIYDRQIEKG